MLKYWNIWFSIRGENWGRMGHSDSHILGAILWWGLSPRFLCYQLESYQILLTGERSYQGLKDSTSFGLLSHRSAEKLEGGNSKNCQFSIPIWSFVFVFVCKWTPWRNFRLGGQHGELKKFEYFESNYSVLLSDNKPNEVASFRYWFTKKI